MSKIFFTASIACAALLLLFCCNKEPYAIQFEKETYDFGEIEVGTDVSYTYVFRNTGANPLVIKHVQTSCGCTTTNGWDRNVEPGMTGKIRITFKPPSFNGETTKYVNVSTNVPGRESIRLTLKGKTIIPIDIVPLNTWLGEIGKDTKLLTGSYTITNNTHNKIKILEVTPPQGNVTHNLLVIEEGRKYRLDYSMAPPFDGAETVGKEFTLKTNDRKHEYIHPKFFYFVPPPVRVVPKEIYVDMTRIARSNIYDVDVKSGMDVPIGILDLALGCGKGITYSVKENVKGRYFQITLTIPKDFKFSETEKTALSFRVLNDPAKTLYSIPIASLEHKKKGGE